MAYTFDTNNPSGLQPTSEPTAKPVKYSFEPSKSQIAGSSFIDSLTAETTYDVTPLSERTGTQVSSAAFQPELTETKATNQGYGELALKAITNFTLGAVGGTVGSAGTLMNVNKLATLFSGDSDLSHHAYAEDNFLESLGKGISEAGPTTYQTQAAKEGFALTDATWWAGTAVPGLSSMVGIMLPAFAVGKGVSMLGRAVEKASLLTKLKSTGKLAELTSAMTKGTGSFLSGQWGQTVSTALAGRMIDSGQSAGQTYKELYNGFKADGFDEDRSKKMASDGARSAYRTSYANIVFDLFEWNMMLKGLSKTNLTKSAYAALDSKLESTLGKGMGANILESQIGKTVESPIKDAILTSITESLDEVVMDASQNLGKRKAEQSAYGTSLTPYLTRQSADSAFIGAFGGLVSFGLFKYLNKKGEVQQDKEYATYVDNIIQRATTLRDDVSLIADASNKGKDVIVDALHQSKAVNMATRAFSAGMHKIDMEVLKNLSSKRPSELTQAEIDDAKANGMSVTTPIAAGKLLDIYKTTISNLELALSDKTVKRNVTNEISNYYNEIDNSTESDEVKNEKKAFVKEHFDTLVDNVITHRSTNKTQHDLLKSIQSEIESADINVRAEYDNFDKIFNDPDNTPTMSKKFAVAKANIIVHDNSVTSLNEQKASLEADLVSLKNHKDSITQSTTLDDDKKQYELDKALESEVNIRTQLSEINDNISNLDTEDISTQREAVAVAEKMLTDLGLTTESTEKDYDKTKERLDELQQNGEITEEDRQFLDDYYKHQHDINKFWEAEKKLSISEAQNHFIQNGIDATKKQSELSTGELVDKIYKSNKEKSDLEFSTIKATIEDNKLNEKTLRGLKSKVDSKVDTRYKELSKTIDTYLADIAEATKVRNERKAAANKEVISKKAKVESKVTTDGKQAVVENSSSKLIDLTINTLSALNDPKLKTFSQFSRVNGEVPSAEAWNINFDNLIEYYTDSKNIDGGYFNITDDVDYIELKDAMSAIQPYLVAIRVNNKNLYIPKGISNSQFNVLVSSLQTAYDNLASKIVANQLMLDTDSIFNATFIISRLNASLKTLNEISPLGEKSSKAQTVSPENSNRTLSEQKTYTESKLKNKSLFQNGGMFANELGGSGVDSILNSVKEINGIEFVSFVNPKSGLVDVIMTGTSDSDYIGYYRLYENGKPTNKWSSKFENKSRSKNAFKTMIQGVQDILPIGHEYTERTSISTDGLRIWQQQLQHGYVLQYDTSGDLITNRVAINGAAIVNTLGIPVSNGDFEKIIVHDGDTFDNVVSKLVPYLEKFGLSENNIYWVNGTVEIDLPILRYNKAQPTMQTTDEPALTDEPTQQSQTTPSIQTTAPTAQELINTILGAVETANKTDFSDVLRKRSELSDDEVVVKEAHDDAVSTLVTAIDALYKLSYGSAPYKVSYYGLLHAFAKATDIGFAMKNYDNVLAAFGFINSTYIPAYRNPDSPLHDVAVDIVTRFQLRDTMKVPDIRVLTLDEGFQSKVHEKLTALSNAYEAKYAGSSDLYAYTRASNTIEVNSNKTILRTQASVDWLNTMIDIQSGDEVSFEVATQSLMKDANRTRRLGSYSNSDLFKPILIKRDGKFIGEVPDIQITDGGINYVKVGTKDGAITHRYNSYIDALLKGANQGALDLIVENQTLLKELFLSKGSDKISKLSENEELYNLLNSFAKHNLKFNEESAEEDYELTNDQLHELLKPMFTNSAQHWFDDVILDKPLLETNYSKYNNGKKEQYQSTLAIRTTLKDKVISLKGTVSNKSLPSLIFGNTSTLIQDVLKPSKLSSNKSRLQLAVLKPDDLTNTLYDAALGSVIPTSLIANYEDLQLGSQKGNIFMLIPRGDGKFTACRSSNSILGVTNGDSNLNNANSKVLETVGTLITDLLLSTKDTSSDDIENMYSNLHKYIITNYGKRDSDIWFKPLVGSSDKPNMILFKSFDSVGNHVYKQIRLTFDKGVYTVVETQGELLNEKMTGLDKSIEGSVLGGTTKSVTKTFNTDSELRGYVNQQCVGLMRNVPIETADGKTKIAMPRKTGEGYTSDFRQGEVGNLFPENKLLDFVLTTGALHTKLGKISDGSGNVITNFNYGNNESSLKPVSKGGLYFKANTTVSPEQTIEDSFNAETTDDLRDWQPFQEYIDLIPEVALPIVRESEPSDIKPGMRPRAEFRVIDTSNKMLVLFDAAFKTLTGLSRTNVAIASDIAHELFHNKILESNLGTLLEQQHELYKTSIENDTPVQILPELQPLVDFRQSLIDKLDSLNDVDKPFLQQLIDYTEPSKGNLDELITNAFFNSKYVNILGNISTDNAQNPSETLLDKLIKVLFKLANITSETYDKSKLKELSNIVSNLLKESSVDANTESIPEVVIETKVDSSSVETDTKTKIEPQPSAPISRPRKLGRSNVSKLSELSENYTIFDGDMKPLC